MNIRLLDILFPKRCVGCGAIGKYVCAGCRLHIRTIAPHEAICPMCQRLAIDGVTHPKCRTPYGLDGLTSFFRYDGPVRSSVKALKYRLVYDLVAEFTALVSDDLLQRIPKAKFLVPVPLHHSRQRDRGFNQAAVLGTFIAARLALSIKEGTLRRVRATVPQVAMRSRKERLGNMHRVFECVTVVQNQHILLFDDVFTSGATMRAAAIELKRKGASEVWAVTMAR